MNNHSKLDAPGAARALVTALALAVLAASCEDPVEFKPAPEPPPGSPEALVTVLAKAYQQRDPELFHSILANEPGANADFLFLLSEPMNTGERHWDYSEEVRIHQRMFRPDQASPPVDSQLWLQNIQITLTQLEPFQERHELYSTNAGEDGKLDPSRWRAVGARYSTYVLWDMAGDIGYKVEGEAYFTVIEDLAKQVGEAGKFFLFMWEDLGWASPPLHTEATSASSWSEVKSLYR